MAKKVKRIGGARKQAGLDQYFEAIGPILAGFQLAAVVVGFLGSGALAKWILSNWFPFTRYVWSLLLSYIKLPDISHAEKDALTTMVFFLPMGIWALYTRFFRKAPSPPVSYKLPALFFGALFVVLLGEQFLRDAYALYAAWGKSPDIVLPFDHKYLSQVLGLGAALLASILGLYTWWSQRGRGAKPGNAHWVYRILPLIANIGLGGSAFVGGIMVFYLEVGPIRSVAFVLTIVLLLVVVYFSPSRLLMSFGVFLMFIIAGLGFDLLLIIVNIVQNAPKELAPSR